MSNYSIERIEEINRKKTANLYALFAGISIFISAVFGLFFPDWIYGAILFCIIPILFLVPYFNNRDKSSIAVALLIHASNFSIVVFNLAFGHKTGSHAFIFPLIAAVSFINPLPKHRLEFWIHMSVSMFLHASIFLFDAYFIADTKIETTDYSTLRVINYALSMVISVYIVYQHNKKSAFSKRQLGSQLSQNNDTLETLRHTVKEKEVLLAEVHHRVKNNLAIISGMLNLRRSLGNKTNVDAVLQECSNRVVSMAMVHEKLYKTGDLNNIPFHDYVNDLCLDIHHTISGDTEVQLFLDLAPLSLNIDKAIPVGLIINEVLTNSIKHAFGKNENGEITVQLKKQHHSAYLMIHDNGKGMPKEFEPGKDESLGFMLIESLSHQIDGSFEFANHNGARFVLRFPID